MRVKRQTDSISKNISLTENRIQWRLSTHREFIPELLVSAETEECRVSEDWGDFFFLVKMQQVQGLRHSEADNCI